MCKKMSSAECNYEIYNKKLLAIIQALEEWRPKLAEISIEDLTNMITDHKNLKYFMSTKDFNKRQAW